MIRVNLLTEKRKKKAKGGPAPFLVMLAAAVLVALLAAAAGIAIVTSKVASLNEQQAANTGVIADLSRKIDEIKRYEKLNKELEQKSGLIETLRKNQFIPVTMLDEVSGLVPEGLWLESLTCKDNGITLEGYAFTNIDIVAYVDNLKKSKAFSDVYLEESREAEIEKVKVYRFKMSFRVRV
ncbi:MAG: PilN domain-containing protein [Nitrospirota bacterium]